VSGWFNRLMAGFQNQNLDTARNDLFPPDDPAQVWRSDNPVGTETLQSTGVPRPTTYAGPVGQFIDPRTGQMTSQGAARMDNPALGLDTGGVGMIKAYHGSPHRFDAFDLSKIGTGEGAQAYGHGMYLAENEGVARSYRDALAQPATPEEIASQYLSSFGGDRNAAMAKMLDHAQGGMGWSPETMANLRQGYQLLKEGAPLSGKPPGHMYEVNVAADPERFLQWDKPLSEQHPDVIKALNNTPYPPRDMRMSVKDYMAELETNREMASKTGDPAAMASQALQEAGIPGIKYLDQGSRSAGEGSHNYVVFDTNSMNIIRRYGLAGLMAGGGAAALGTTQQEQ